MFPIKYIDNNLVWNKDNEVFAYYELIPYNYSFLSAEQKFIVHDSFRQLIAQSREGKIHALQIATESSIRSMQEQSKKLVTGKLKEVACQKIDEHDGTTTQYKRHPHIFLFKPEDLDNEDVILHNTGGQYAGESH